MSHTLGDFQTLSQNETFKGQVRMALLQHARTTFTAAGSSSSQKDFAHKVSMSVEYYVPRASSILSANADGLSIDVDAPTDATVKTAIGSVWNQLGNDQT